SGARGGYSVVRSGLSYTVTDTNVGDGDDGTDTLSGIEWLQFNDGLLHLGGTPLMDNNADGKSDLLVKSTDGTTLMWVMNGNSITSNSTMVGAGGRWSFINARGDFNADGKGDLLVTSTNGTTLMWLMNGNSITSNVTMLGAGGPWSVVDAQGDYN